VTKGLHFLALFTLSLFVGFGCRAQSPAAPAGHAVGFGSATTGACQGATCTCFVTRLDDPPRAVAGGIRSCTEIGGRRTLFRARGKVQLDSPLRVASDTTIDGRPLANGDAPVTLAGPPPGLLLIADRSNIVVRNLFFRIDSSSVGVRCAIPNTPTETKGCGVPLYVKGSARNIWVDHNDFDRCGEKCISVWTETLTRDASGRAPAPDLLTISNNRFTNSYFGVLVGSSELLAKSELPRSERVTMYGNVFANVFRRSPASAASFSKLHAFNNLVTHWGRRGQACRGTDRGFAASSVGEAELLLENNIFEPWPGAETCKLAADSAKFAPKRGYDRGLGRVRASGNLLMFGAQLEQSAPAQVFKPAYAYPLRPVAGLADTLTRTAGVEGYPHAALP
jgi:pectate lyase